VLGRNCRFLQGPGTDRRAVREIRKAIDNRVECTVRLVNYTKTGQAFWNLFSLAPVLDADGSVRYFIGVQVDVTARCAGVGVEGLCTLLLGDLAACAPRWLTAKLAGRRRRRRS
jgi:hypothetical protein